MAGLDELFAQIPVQDIASKVGADEGEVNNAIRTLVPALVGGLAQNVQSNDIDSSKLESAVAQQGDPGYKATSVLLGESGLALALDRDKLTDLRGVLTPAAAMGDALLARFPAAGVSLATTRLD